MDKKWKLNMRYKSNLENARSLEEIQKCYELECETALLEFQDLYPCSFRERFLIEHLHLWVLAEKTALALFGRPKTCWIKQTYIQGSEERGL